MIFTPYTQPVKPAEWVAPFNLDLYGKGLMYKQQMAEKNLQSIVSDVGKVFSAKTYGPDRRRMGEIEQEFRQQMESLNISDLSDINTFAQMKGLISKYANDPEVLASVKRASVYDSEMQRKQKAEEKGEGFISPALDTLSTYYNQENFYEKPKEVNLTTGFYSFNEAKAWEGAKKLATEKKDYITDKDGRRVQVSYYDPSDLMSAFKTYAASDPNYSKTMRYQFDKIHKDTDWLAYANEQNTTMVQNAKTVYDEAKSIYSDPTSTSEEKQTALNRMTSAQNIINTYSDLYDTPENEQEVKENAYNDYVNKKINLGISAIDAVQKTPLSMDEIFKMDRENKLRLQTDEINRIANVQVESGLDPNASKYRDAKGGFKKGEYLKDAAAIIQANKLSNAKAAKLDPNAPADPSARVENYINWTRANAVKDLNAQEKMNYDDYVKKQIDTFRKLGFGNINKIEEVSIDYETGNVTINFDRPGYSGSVTAPIGTIVDDYSGDKVVLTPTQLADILTASTSEKFLNDVKQRYNIGSQNPPPKKMGTITLSNGKQVSAVILDNPSDTAYLKKGEYAIVMDGNEGKPFQKE
jgi:hypothetical protein